VRADWSCRIQFAESSIAEESFQQQGAEPLILLLDGPTLPMMPFACWAQGKRSA
jgi:hypothetical protein